MKKEITYLTEQSLGEFLQKAYPNGKWIHNKKCPGTKYRPDYRSDDLKMIVEFDGYQHYTNAKNVSTDLNKNMVFKNLGYKVIRIPYFVQLSTQSVKDLFGIDFEIEQTFPHGFIDDNVVFPCDFCEFGVWRFNKDLDLFSTDIANQIIQSCIDKFMASKDQTMYEFLPMSIIKDLGFED